MLLRLPLHLISGVVSDDIRLRLTVQSFSHIHAGFKQEAASAFFPLTRDYASRIIPTLAGTLLHFEERRHQRSCQDLLSLGALLNLPIAR